MIPGDKGPCVKPSGIEPLSRILEDDRAIAAWLKSEKDRWPELFALLADKLSGSEKKALDQVAQLVAPWARMLARKLDELRQENEHLTSLSLTDALTGLYNYRFFSKQLEVEMARSARTGLPCSLMMIDLDNFKTLNDALGHDEGNRFLVQAARIAGEKLRPTDSLCRFGGDEFAVIMPATVLMDAVQIARRLRKTLCRIPRAGSPVPVSASIGLAEYDPMAGWDADEFLKKADNALYRAKKTGKNSVCYEGILEERATVPAVSREEKSILLNRDSERSPRCLSQHSEDPVSTGRRG